MTTNLWGIHVAGGAASLPTLDELDPTETIDQGVDVAGGFQARPLLSIDDPVKTYTQEYHIVAPALTEACCQLGIGKVRTLSLCSFLACRVL